MKYFAALLLAFIPYTSLAATQFSGPDYSGIYDCKGQDHSEGAYTGTVTLTLIPAQSVANNGAYQLKFEVPNYGTYLGHTAAQGKNMALHFALTDPSGKDFGTGIATFSKTKNGKWSFAKYYYQPEYKGGNYGTEQCVAR